MKKQSKKKKILGYRLKLREGFRFLLVHMEGVSDTKCQNVFLD